MSSDRAHNLTPFEVRRLAVAAIADEATVRRFITGLPIRSTSRVRIERAVRRLRLHINPEEDATTTR